MATVISSGKLNLRTSPSKSGEILCILNPGEELLIEDLADGWAHVYTSSGAYGYVMSEYISLNGFNRG
jgi:uncharacterized protein YgiM (DUF1202 family)